MRSVEPALNLGEEVAGYRLESLVARGGMGVVYRAEDIRLGRPVALKVLAPTLSADEKFRLRFVRESQLAAAVEHPNILPIYSAGEWSELLYIAMRFVNGSDAQTEVETRGALPLGEALHILVGAGDALDAAHAAGLVHRDVKPGNILLSRRPTPPPHVYLADFGLTKRASSSSGLTTTGHFVGTLDYVSPEQIRGEPIDGRADVYALACVAHTLLTGHPPYEHDDDSAQLWAHMSEAPPIASRLRPDLPRSVDAAIVAGMAKERDDRPTTCGELIDAMLRDVAVRRPVESARPSGEDFDAFARSDPAPLPLDPADDETPVGTPTMGAPGDDEAHSPRPRETGGPRFSPPAGTDGRATRRVPRRVIVAGVLGALAVVVVLALIVPSLLGGRTADLRVEEVPYTLTVPAQWTQRSEGTGASTVSVASATDLTGLFADDPGALDASAADIDAAPGDGVGLAVYHRPSGLEGESGVGLLEVTEALLPGLDARLVDEGPVDAGDVEAQAMEGSIPLSDSTELQVRALVTRTDPVQLLVFFAPPSLFDERSQTFDEVAASLRLTDKE